MIKSGLFWRLFSAILAALLVTVLIFSGVLAASERQSRQRNYENEVRLQALEIAEYMTNLNQLSSIRDNATMRYIIGRKIADIHEIYNAAIWLVSFDSGLVQYMDSSWNTTESLTSPAVLEQLSIIQSGYEIRVTGLFSELGDQIVTIGVPWRYIDRQVVGGVLLHISTESLAVDVADLLPQILPAALAALVLGATLSIFLARSQTKPLKEIDNAVRAFSMGDLTRRIELHCGGELEELGHSINRMVTDLAQLEDSRRNFVAAVSHELRSPMTCMRGYVQAMLDGIIPSKDVPHYLQIVMDETNRLTDLVRDLLELSRFESGKFPLQIAPFDANEMLRRILINFEQRIDAKHVDVDVHFASEHCWVQGDASRINQVITNFIDNALKFMPPYGGILSVATRPEGKQVRFVVQDNGIGIAPSDLPHIFERFYKADKAHTSGMGTGLGLSICKLIVREHGSDIAVHSQPGETVFSFTLPAAEMPLLEEKNPNIV